MIAKGGIMLELHFVVFPQEWFKLIIHLRCIDEDVLTNRLKERGLSEAKIAESVERETGDIL